MTSQEKINFIKEWYSFKSKLCEKYNSKCKGCPLHESTDGWIGDSKKYEYVDNCKYDFEDAYVEDIIDLMEKQKQLDTNL